MAVPDKRTRVFDQKKHQNIFGDSAGEQKIRLLKSFNLTSARWVLSAIST
jgi:hypothetical protein